ncbi:Acyl-coenzyme A oxidase-like protein (Acyl-CoA oxidase-like protein), partial [Durusdinium trenchii]
NTSERVAKMAGQSPSWAPQHGWAVFEAEEAPLTAILAILPTWASLALAFSAFVTAFAIVASTQALLYWETIHWPWSRIKRSPRDVSSMWDPTSLAASKLQYDSLARREELLMKRFLSINKHRQMDENAPWQEHAEQLRDLLKGGYLSLDSITSSDGMLDFFASHRVLAHQECLSCCLGIRMTVHYNLFCGTVLALGNEEQCRWLEESQTRGQLGCFMLTEVGAGVLSGLVVETTATWTWDAEGGGFDLHTPSASAEKTWISQGLAADWGVVVANLVLEENLGPHVFLVDMQSIGLQRQSMGEKTTFNALDNARVSFDHARLPATALLSKLCSVQQHVFPDGSWRAEYTFAGRRPPSFVQIAQRLLSGRLCISDSAIAYVEGVLRVTRKYAESRRVWVDKERQMQLSELPYMRKVLHSVEVGLNVHKAFLLILQKEFAQAIQSGQELSRQLVTRIAAAKVEAVEFAIKSLALMRRDVGSFSLMASSPFGSNNDILLCCRFAEGDSRILQQMLTRDLVKAHSKSAAATVRLLLRVLKAWLSGALHSPAKLEYLRDQQLLQLLWDLARVRQRCLKKGMSKAQAETEAWIQADLVYDVAKTHAQQLIHSTVEAECGRSKDTLRFMDMCISDCEARHV